jgi:hypothetical protein
MKIDKSVSEQALGGRRRIQFDASKDRAKVVELITFLFDQSREAEHVDKQNERRLEWLRHRILGRSASSLAWPITLLYLNELVRRALRLHTLGLLRQRIVNGDDEPQNFHALWNEEFDLAVWFTDQPGEIKALFAPFLRLT